MVQDPTNRWYPKFVEGEGSVAEFRYEEKGPEGTSDGDYKEVIQFQIPAEIGNGKSFTNESLQQVKLLYYKECFCKGEAGYYQVTEGALQISRTSNGALTFNLQFKLGRVNHTIYRIARQ